MKKSFLSMILLIILALLLLSADASRGSEGRSAPQSICSVADDSNCAPKECGIRNCGMIDLGCGLGAVSCGECSENQSCDDGICRRAGSGQECPCGGYWPNDCEVCPDPATPPASRRTGGC